MATTCKNCGKEISENDAFCPYCGTKNDANPTPQTANVSGTYSNSSNSSSNCNNNCNCGQNPTAPKKDRMTAALLGIFLGSLGIHYFYMGKTTAGVLSIVISACSCGIWSLVMFIQSILILTMTDSQFEEKYINNPSSFPLF